MEGAAVTQADAERFLAELPEKDRQILQLRLEGYTLEEIAERLGYKNHSGVLKRIRKIGEAYQQYANVDLDFDIMKDMTNIYGDVDVDASVSGLVTPWTDKGLGLAGFGSVKGALSVSDDKLDLDYVGGGYIQLSKEMDKIDVWVSGLFADEISGEENDKNIYHTSEDISEEDFKEIVAEFKEIVASYEEMLTMYTGEDAEAVVEDIDTHKVEDFYTELSQKITDSLVISDDVVKFDGYDCYEMTSSINLGELGLVEFAKELAGDEAELDKEIIDMANMMLSSIQIDTTVYLNSAYEPRYFKVDLSKSDVQSVVREIFKMEFIGKALSEDDFNSQYRDHITVDIDDLSFELSILKSDAKDMADYVSNLGTVVEWTEED